MRLAILASLSLLTILKAQQAYTWHNVEIAGGGFVPGIVAHPAQPGLMYARTDIGGAYRWDINAKRWIPLNDWIDKNNWNYTGIESIGLDPNDPSRLYLAGGTYTQSFAGNGAIFRSTNQGATFQVTPMPFQMGGNEDGRHAGERLAVDPADGSHLLFGSRSAGLWSSSDYGATWSKIAGLPATVSTNNLGIVFVIFDRAEGVVYAGASSSSTALYRSKDGGANWQPVDRQPSGLLPNHGVLAGDGSLYISYGDQPGPNNMTKGAVWKYDTRADAWTDVTPVQPNSRIGFGYAGLAVDAQSPSTVMVATMDRWSIGDDIFRSTDGGAHWAGMKALSHRNDKSSPWITFGAAASSFGWWLGNVTIDPFNSERILYTTGATIWATDHVTSSESIRWSPRAEGLEETAVQDLLSPPNAGQARFGKHASSAVLISALGDIGGFRHDDLTVSPRAGMFINPVFSTTSSLDFAELNPSVVVRAGSSNSGRHGAVSTDGGASWTPFAAEPAGSQGSGTIAVSADGSSIVWTPLNTAPYFTTDQGTTWSQCVGLSAGSRVISDRVNSQKFYALDSSTSRIFLSTNGGANFTVRSNPLSKSNAWLRALPGVEGDLWFTSPTSGFQHSIDGGATWSRVTTAQADTFGFGRPADDGAYPAIYIIGQIAGLKAIYRSDDRAATWTRINDDLHQFATSSVIIGDPKVYGRVYIGNNGRGIIYGDITRQPK